MGYAVCIIKGVWEGEDPDKTATVKNELKQLICAASGVPASKIMVFYDQNIRFNDKEGVYCEIKWPRRTIPQFQPKRLRGVLSSLFKRDFRAKRVCIDFVIP